MLNVYAFDEQRVHILTLLIELFFRVGLEFMKVSTEISTSSTKDKKTRKRGTYMILNRYQIFVKLQKKVYNLI